MRRIRLRPPNQVVTRRDRGHDSVPGRHVDEVKVLGLVGITAHQLGNFQVRAGVRRARPEHPRPCMADGERGRSRLTQKLADVGAAGYSTWSRLSKQTTRSPICSVLTSPCCASLSSAHAGQA